MGKTLATAIALVIAVFALAANILLVYSLYEVFFEGVTFANIAGHSFSSTNLLLCVLLLWSIIQRAQAHWRADFLVNVDQWLAVMAFFASLAFAGYALAKMTPGPESIAILALLVVATFFDWILGFDRRSTARPGMGDIGTQIACALEKTESNRNIVITLLSPGKGVTGYDVTVETPPRSGAH